MSSEIMFWTSWVIIPLIVEIIPSILGFFLLLRKRLIFIKDPHIKYIPHITIIIPIYNSAGTLEECLDSVVASDYPKEKLAVILVNNGSKDDSFEVFQNYQSTHTFMNLKWINAQQGKSKALNMALYNSKGKYIIHIDSDGILHPDALKNLIRRFEAHENIDCMTGVILTNPRLIDQTTGFFKKIMQKTEFFEYAQAFLAGRNYEAELNSIFTMSGAFSAFRKSTILKTQLYNTDTVCEDTHVTFQVRRLLKKKIDLCENAIFFVDPIENVQKLYVQRQRWQRGELEVAHMFPEENKGVIHNFILRLLLFDHTFAFPRMIWYFALICLTFLEYPYKFIIISLLFIYILYIVSGFLYYLNICSYLYWDKKLKKYYAKKLPIIFILPIFNFIVYWFRFAGIINSIKGTSSWKTKTLQEEFGTCKKIISSDFLGYTMFIKKIKRKVYKRDAVFDEKK
jgi:putative glycosyltransferase (exosortase G-associated)